MSIQMEYYPMCIQRDWCAPYVQKELTTYDDCEAAVFALKPGSFVCAANHVACVTIAHLGSSLYPKNTSSWLREDSYPPPSRAKRMSEWQRHRDFPGHTASQLQYAGYVFGAQAVHTDPNYMVINWAFETADDLFYEFFIEGSTDRSYDKVILCVPAAIDIHVDIEPAKREIGQKFSDLLNPQGVHPPENG